MATHPAIRLLLPALLALIPLQRILLALAQPDLLHDLDAGELKHLDLALFGLPAGDGLADQLHRWLAAPENVHHGGYPVVALLFAALAKVAGPSLFLLRLIPIAATTLAAGLVARLVQRRAGSLAATVTLLLFAGGPALFLKWTSLSRGGHLEGIVLPVAFAVLLDRALRGSARRWLVAGIVGGFSVYFTYLAAPAVVLLSLGALAEKRDDRLRPAALLLLGGLLGFLPWIAGLLLLDMPYLDASVHMTSNPEEAAEVQARTLLTTAQNLLASLDHNLWPWGVTRSPEAAYGSITPDILVFEPSQFTVVARALVSFAVLAGLARAATLRSPLLVALCLLPAVHHAFVLRFANTVGYPDIPHRYLVIAFPAIAAAAGLGCSFNTGFLRHPARLLAAALATLALAGLVANARWLGPPRMEQFSSWDAGAFRQAGVGQVRVDEGAQVLAMLRSDDAWIDDLRRGVGLVYPGMADYYLLFRDDPDARPYPDGLFREPDPLSNVDEQRRALVRGALAATAARAADHEAFDELVCSWRPHPEFYAAMRAELPPLPCSLAPEPTEPPQPPDLESPQPASEPDLAAPPPTGDPAPP